MPLGREAVIDTDDISMMGWLMIAVLSDYMFFEWTRSRVASLGASR